MLREIFGEIVSEISSEISSEILNEVSEFICGTSIEIFSGILTGSQYVRVRFPVRFSVRFQWVLLFFIWANS